MLFSEVEKAQNASEPHSEECEAVREIHMRDGDERNQKGNN